MCRICCVFDYIRLRIFTNYIDVLYSCILSFLITEMTYITSCYSHSTQYPLMHTKTLSLIFCNPSSYNVLFRCRGNHFSLDLTQTVGLLGQVISQSHGHCENTGQHKRRINTGRHKRPCLKWDSNPRSQRPSERGQFMPQTARLPWSALSFITELCSGIYNLS
jgi:hypothetical protein